MERLGANVRTLQRAGVNKPTRPTWRVEFAGMNVDVWLKMDPEMSERLSSSKLNTSVNSSSEFGQNADADELQRYTLFLKRLNYNISTGII